MASIVVTLLALMTGVGIAEYLAAHYRPERQAKRRQQQYQALMHQLHAPENYAAAVPMQWQTYARPSGLPARVLYEPVDTTPPAAVVTGDV